MMQTTCFGPIKPLSACVYKKFKWNWKRNIHT